MEDVRDVVSLSLDKRLGGEGEEGEGWGDKHFGSFSFVGGVDVCCCCCCCFGEFGLEEWKGSWLVVVWKDTCTAVYS